MLILKTSAKEDTRQKVQPKANLSSLIGNNQLII